MENPKKTPDEKRISYIENYKQRNRAKFSFDDSKQKSKYFSLDSPSPKAKVYGLDDLKRYSPSEINERANTSKKLPVIKPKNIGDSGFRKLEDDGKKAFEEVEKIVTSKKAKRIEFAIVVIIYIIVLGIAAYFILASLFPQYLPTKTQYTISANDPKLFNNLNSFYIDDPSVLGDKKIIGNTTVRPIISSKKFNFVFAPKENIKAGTNATFSMKLYVNDSKPGNIYVDDNLIFPDLTNYQLIKETSTDYIYANKDILKYVDQSKFVSSVKEVQESSSNSNESVQINIEIENGQEYELSTEEFIYKNLPGSSVWSTRTLKPLDIRIPDYKQEWTLINTTFRDNLKLAVYAEGILNVDFTKQDLNNYIGEDEYTVEVKDSSGNTLYNRIIRDDGDKSNSNKLGGLSNNNIKVTNLDSAVYYITFTKDKYNDGSDSTIKNIKINSNKILIVGNFLPWDKFNFYNKVNFQKQINFLYWWKGKGEKLIISGTENINLTLPYGKKESINLYKKGDYKISSLDGFIWIYNDYSAIITDLSNNKTTLYKYSWFDIPLSSTPDNKINNQNLIIIDKDLFNKNKNIVIYNKEVDVSKNTIRIGLRCLETNSVSFEEVQLNIKEKR